MTEQRPQSVKEKERFSSHGNTRFIVLRGKWGLAVDKVVLWLTGYSLITAQYARAAGDSYQPTLMLYTKGARSGKQRLACLPYYRVGEHLIVRGSNGGGATDPHWVHNIRAHGEVRVRIRRSTRATCAHVASGEERAHLYEALCKLSRSTSYYQTMCSPRELPLAVINI